MALFPTLLSALWRARWLLLACGGWPAQIGAQLIDGESGKFVSATDLTLCPGGDGWLHGHCEGCTAIGWFETATAEKPLVLGPDFPVSGLAETRSWWVAGLDSRGHWGPKREVFAFVRMGLQAQFESQSQLTEVGGLPIYFRAECDQPIKAWLWDFGDGEYSSRENPIHHFNREGRYTISLTLTDEWGCSATISREQYIEVGSDTRLLVPNAFTPNGDLTNDEFNTGSEGLAGFQIMVFDAQGQLMFESQDVNFKWDGTDLQGREAAEGTYTWIITARSRSGAEIRRTGSVILLR